MAKFIKIAVPAPLFGDFDYLNTAQTQQLQPGCRVLVPFGRRKLIGMVVGHTNNSNIPKNKLRAIEKVIEVEPILNKQSLDLANWIASYYHHPLGEVIFTMLPKNIRNGSIDKILTLTDTGLEILHTSQRAKKQLQLCQLLSRGAQTNAQLLQQGFSTQVIKACLEKKLISETTAKKEVHLKIDATLKNTEKTANKEQKSALEKIHAATGFVSFLLFGVTGSGKTEVYLQAIANVLQQNKQALVLVPEISLTQQTITRFTNRFNTQVVTLHSAMTDAERMRSWSSAADSSAGIIIGTRSAVFAQIPRLGIIIIDEEHDESYKQQNSLRYHARDIAIWRAKQLDIPIILGSATPSLPSWENVNRDKFVLLKLAQRVQNAQLPEISIIDQRNIKNDTQLLHPEIIAHAQKVIANNKQVLFFLNRRGFAEVCICFSCGFEERCTTCDGRLILHKNPQRLCCHRCDKTFAFNQDCKKCQQSQIGTLGVGTQQLEQFLQSQFPTQKILRIDRDTTQQRNSLQNLLQNAHDNSAKILVGTQMLAKGHDFANLDCVVILNADCALFSTDFHAEENLAQLISQVSGRAGRRNNQGKVFIQTLCPSNPLWLQLQQHEYWPIAEKLLQQRRQANLPPYNHQVLIAAEDKKIEQAEARLNVVAQAAQRFSRMMPDITVTGPIPAPIARIRDRYRMQLWLQGPSRQQLHKLIDQLIKQKCLHKLQIDIAPLNIM